MQGQNSTGRPDLLAALALEFHCCGPCMPLRVEIIDTAILLKAASQGINRERDEGWPFYEGRVVEDYYRPVVGHAPGECWVEFFGLELPSGPRDAVWKCQVTHQLFEAMRALGTC